MIAIIVYYKQRDIGAASAPEVKVRILASQSCAGKQWMLAEKFCEDLSMNCRDIAGSLLDMGNGLPLKAHARTQLRYCRSCAKSLRQMLQIMALLEYWQAPEPSVSFDRRLKARLREESARSLNRWTDMRELD